jgi:hypothetical protein
VPTSLDFLAAFWIFVWHPCRESSA